MQTIISLIWLGKEDVQLQRLPHIPQSNLKYTVICGANEKTTRPSYPFAFLKIVWIEIED